MQQPRHPSSMSKIAQQCLTALADAALGEVVSLGGALGLSYYCDYRTTHDVDAWWETDATGAQQREVIGTITQVLAAFGPTRERQWGDVTSVELREGNKTVFSFQIAQRSARIDVGIRAPDTGVLLDSLEDLVASKMVALVERGAPRDFRDIHQVCTAGLLTPSTCWQLWRKRQLLAGADVDRARAKLAIETHLSRIAQYRPLALIADSTQRQEAEGLRNWFGEVFLHADDT